jgi:hypothetical protein
MSALPPHVLQVDTDEAARLLGISRDTLDRMTREAPATLPGAPVDVGNLGGKRRKLMWHPATLMDWWRAYGAWRAAQASPGVVKAPAHRKGRAAPAGQPGRGKLTLADITAARRAR